jgi:polyisoprenoid-binding protein YceI
METKKTNLFAGSTIAALAIVIALFSSCKKEDVVTQIDSTVTPTGMVIDASVGSTNSTLPAAADKYYLDKSHSNVGWETKYYGENALLTGRFNWFDMFVTFDKDNPANTKINAVVKLSTFNTGEPGRDGLGKCGLTSMGITYTDAENTLVNPATDTAWFNSTGCEKHGDGFLVKGNFKFRGVTKPVDMYLTHTGIATSTNATSGKKVNRVGFKGEFKFNANTDYAVNSSSIDDVVTVKVNCNVRTKEY